MKKNFFMNKDLNERTQIFRRTTSFALLIVKEQRLILLKEGDNLKLNPSIYEEVIASEDDLECLLSSLEEKIGQKVKLTVQAARYLAKRIMVMKQ